MAAKEERVLEATFVGGDRAESSRGDLHLLVMGQGVFSKLPVAAGQSLVIGRAENADVRLEDPRASRRHARLCIGDTVTVEDLGSANGTEISDVKLEPGKSYELVAGESVTIGSTMLMVQQAWAATRPKRLWPHGYFEARVEEECARADRSGAKLAVVRIQIDLANDSEATAIVAEHLRAGDVLARYGPADLEVLLVDADALGARQVLNRVTKALRRANIACRTGIACYPDDGRTPERLISQACSFVLGATGGAPAPPVVVRSDAMKRLYDVAERIAKGTISVLILGETGVGKEVLAEWIHRSSPRADKPYLRLNCAAFSDALVESELFGHERGSFTGAAASKLGLLETAEGGTVFLDEVGELPMALQAKLLRVLETHEVVRVGALKPKKIDVRFIAATNRDLEAEVLQSRFRQDLYFRLNGATLVIPPLRERIPELEELCSSFLHQAALGLGRPPPRLSPPALDALNGYWWPGNLRELRNVLERAVLLCGGDDILPEHLPLEKMGGLIRESATNDRAARTTHSSSQRAVPATPSPPSGSTDMRQTILDALGQCAGNQSRAAKLLGISRRTLVTRLDELGLPRPRK